MASSNTVSSGPSAWAPLRVAAFRGLWIAQLFSLIGTWMQTVGAQWLLVDEPNAATLVALVQTAAMLPILVLALPAGALADILDRRRLLIAVQLFQVVVGVVLLALTLLDRLSPSALLLVTLLLGIGTTLMIPAYQTLVGELVGRPQMRSAAALGGVAMQPGQGGRPGDRRPADRRGRGRRGLRPQRAQLRRDGPGAAGIRPAPAEETRARAVPAAIAPASGTCGIRRRCAGC